MSEKIESLDEFDQLSLLLDELNAGRQPNTDDEETAELLLVATLLRHEGEPVTPPPHILERTVDRALEGITQTKPKPVRSWWYSGAFSAAAAALVILGLQLFPSWQQQPPIVVSPPSVAREQTAPQAPVSTSIPPTATDMQPQANEPPAKNIEQARPAPAAQPPAITPPVVAKPATDTLPVQAAAIPEQPQPPASAPILAQQPPGNTAASREQTKPPVTAKAAEEVRSSSNTKSIHFERSTASIPENVAPTLTPLTLPGKTADIITIDKESGSVRQVFFKGTPQEITITQSISAANSTVTPKSSRLPSATDKAVDTTQTGLTTVQLTIDGQDVLIEGRRSQQELLQLAESLR